MTGVRTFVVGWRFWQAEFMNAWTTQGQATSECAVWAWRDGGQQRRRAERRFSGASSETKHDWARRGGRSYNAAMTRG